MSKEGITGELKKENPDIRPLQVDNIPFPARIRFLLPHGLIHYFIIGGTRQPKFMMVLVNNCAVHLGTHNLYCTGNLHKQEYSFVESRQHQSFETYLLVCFQCNE